MADRYENNAQQRILKVMLALAGNEIKGLEPTALSKGLAIPAANITRDLNNLKIAGLAEKLPDSNRWRLSPKLAQVAVSILNHFDKSQRQLDEARNRFTRQPR